MEIIRRIVVTLFGVTMSVVLAVLVMIHGWGLEPKSYWWIIGVGIFGQVLCSIIVKIGYDKD